VVFLDVRVNIRSDDIHRKGQKVYRYQGRMPQSWDLAHGGPMRQEALQNVLRRRSKKNKNSDRIVGSMEGMFSTAM
jgi:hypothetical protein